MAAKNDRKKYKVEGIMSARPPQGFSQAYRTTFSDKQIDFRCGSSLVLEYADYQAIQQ